MPKTPQKIVLTWAGKPPHLQADFWYLIAGNIFTAILAIVQHWSLLNLMLAYIIESIIIGILWVLSAYKKPVEGSDDSVKISIDKKQGIGTLASVYFGFHLLYLIFLSQLIPWPWRNTPTAPELFDYNLFVVNWLGLGLAGLGFLVSNLILFLRNTKQTNEQAANSFLVQSGLIWFRSFFIHTTLIFGFILLGLLPKESQFWVLIFFLGLKLLVEIITFKPQNYIVEP